MSVHSRYESSRALAKSWAVIRQFLAHQGTVLSTNFLEVTYSNNETLWVSHWSGDAHPAKLFEGVNKRLEIVISRRRSIAKCRVFSSKYLKWYSEERPTLFTLYTLSFSIFHQKSVFNS